LAEGGFGRRTGCYPARCGVVCCAKDGVKTAVMLSKRKTVAFTRNKRERKDGIRGIKI